MIVFFLKKKNWSTSIRYKKAWWRPNKGGMYMYVPMYLIQWECGPLPLTLECAMMIRYLRATVMRNPGREGKS